MKKPFRIGVAGLGFGAKVHIPAWQSLKGVVVCAIAGAHKDHAREIAGHFSIPYWTDNLRDFFRQPMDAVSLALPPAESEKAIRMALQKKIPVLAEKPLAVSAARAKALARLSSQTVTAVDFQFAELPVFQKLKTLLDARRYGNIRHVRIGWFVESYAQKKKEWSWKTDDRRGGGVVNVLGSHLFYLLEWLFGPVQGCSAFLDAQATAPFAPRGAAPGPDFMSVSFSHPSLAGIAVVVSQASPGGSSHRWEIVCERGTLILENISEDYMNGFVLRLRCEGKTIILDDRRRSDGQDGRLAPFASLASRFVQSIRTGRSLHPDFQDGARVQDITHAIYRSWASRRFITL